VWIVLHNKKILNCISLPFIAGVGKILIDGKKMVVMHESFFTVLKDFPTHSKLIQQLFQNSEVFRETCLDYHQCSKALNYWSTLASPEALTRQEEYSNLLAELEQEIIQAVSPQYAKKINSVSMFN